MPSNKIKRRKIKQQARQNVRQAAAKRIADRFANKVVTEKDRTVTEAFHHQCLSEMNLLLTVTNTTDYITSHWLSRLSEIKNETSRQLLKDYWEAIAGASCHARQVISDTLREFALISGFDNEFDKMNRILSVLPHISEFHSLGHALEDNLKHVAKAHLDCIKAEKDGNMDDLVIDFDKLDIQDIIARSIAYQQTQLSVLHSFEDVAEYVSISDSVQKALMATQEAINAATEAEEDTPEIAQIEQPMECPAVEAVQTGEGAENRRIECVVDTEPSSPITPVVN